MSSIARIATDFKAACDVLGLVCDKSDIYELMKMAQRVPTPPPSLLLSPVNPPPPPLLLSPVLSAASLSPQSTPSGPLTPLPATPPRPPPWEAFIAPAEIEFSVVYTLKLRGGKFYVGFTKNLPKRLEQHFTGTDSAMWTKYYPMERVIDIEYNGNKFMEGTKVLMLMALHGIDNVRGGAFVTARFTPDERQAIEKQLWGATDACLKCGDPTHFAVDCTSYNKRARMDTTYEDLPPVDEGLFAARRELLRSPHVVCTRCGRGKHNAAVCFAKTHRNKTELPPLTHQ